MWSRAGWLQDIAGHKPEDDHDSVDEVLSRGAAVFLPAESGEDEEDGQPDDQLVAREHTERAQQQRNETGPVGLVRRTREPRRVVVVDIFICFHFMSTILLCTCFCFRFRII
jgi:hypothetical protein